MKTVSEEAPVTCPDCLALPPQAVGKYVLPEWVIDFAKIKTWPNLTARTRLRHQIDEGQVLAFYKIPKQRVVCSQGIHRHFEGCIVRTRCGLILRLGWQCAEQVVAGFDRWKKDEREHLRHLNSLATARHTPPRLLSTLEFIVPRLKSFVERRRREEHLQVGQEMIKRAKAGQRGERVAMRELDRRWDKKSFQSYTKILIVDYAIRGLAMWRRDPSEDLAVADQLLVEAEDLCRRGLRAHELTDHELVALVDRTTALSSKVDRLKRLIESFNAFYSEANQSLVREAVKQGFN